ncbi:hypothetical protein [Brevundimonas sp.]|uniref:hypothetical protein n=1 Tax=Brevundimonas sp. TaxID=1871086 RepID=UPI002D67CDD7|nr:hypothetical protein [Brevundimonas sp.]HYD26481.1 hypothetical protein [Brevundimonas sp.]
MKPLSLALTTALLAASASLPAAAQTASAQVNVTGFVAPRCGALDGSTTVTGSIALGELAGQDGQIRTGLANSTTGSPAGTVAMQIGCTGSAANLSLSATRLSNAAAPALATSSNDIDYTVEAAIALATGGHSTVNYTTAAAAPAATPLAVNSTFAFVPGNLEIRVFDLTPEHAAPSLLVPGTYQATVTLQISPD